MERERKIKRAKEREKNKGSVQIVERERKIKRAKEREKNEGSVQIVERERKIKRAKEREKNEGRLGERTRPFPQSPLVFSRSFARLSFRSRSTI